MKTDVFQSKKAPPSTDELPIGLDPDGIALCQADCARLFGVTRQRISQMVSRGQLTTRPDGRINPSRAAAELLRSDAPQARSKILVAIRQQIERAEAERSAALARAAAAEARATRAAQQTRCLAELLIRAERRLHHLETSLDGLIDDDLLCECLDQAFSRAADEPLSAGLAGLDEDTADTIHAALRLAEPPPPPADQPEVTA
ncbi:hypothetical protein [Thiobaca trueperi]|uniref:hypothetical protein n=1 Tax=Thiobaca trueperi TaxID=127458 RepID=UPI001054063D|nr:hypothetical protein [Thiobaca trueperi]